MNILRRGRVRLLAGPVQLQGARSLGGGEQPPTPLSGHKTKKISQAMLAYLQAAKNRDEFITNQVEEYEMGRRHLANMMSVRVEDLGEEEVERAIEYLLPSALWEPRSRPLLKHPERLWPAQKAPQFGLDGRPHHPFFYTTKPNFYQLMHDIADKVARVRNADSHAHHSSQAVAPPPLSLLGSEWISEDALKKRTLEPLSEENYKQMVAALDFMASLPMAGLEQEFIMNLRTPLGGTQADIGIEIPKIQTCEETGREFVECLGKRKQTRATVRLWLNGTGKYTLNGMDISEIPGDQNREQLLAPLILLGRLGSVDVESRTVQLPSDDKSCTYHLDLAPLPFHYLSAKSGATRYPRRPGGWREQLLAPLILLGRLGSVDVESRTVQLPSDDKSCTYHLDLAPLPFHYLSAKSGATRYPRRPGGWREQLLAPLILLGRLGSVDVESRTVQLPSDDKSCTYHLDLAPLPFHYLSAKSGATRYPRRPGGWREQLLAPLILLGRLGSLDVESRTVQLPSDDKSCTYHLDLAPLPFHYLSAKAGATRYARRPGGWREQLLAPLILLGRLGSVDVESRTVQLPSDDKSCTYHLDLAPLPFHYLSAKSGATRYPRRPGGWREQLLAPLILLGRLGSVDVESRTVQLPSDDKSCTYHLDLAPLPFHYLSAKAGATRMGLSLAMTALISDEERERLRLTGLLSHDWRCRVRKKPGQKGARAKWRWQKR